MSMLRPALNLAVNRFWETRKGIHIIGTWVRADGKAWKPCIVLMDASKPIREFSVVPCVIPLDNAHLWAMHSEVGDPAHVVKTVCEWLHYGYLPGDPSNKKDYMAIVNLVNERLPDLIAMPLRPATDGEVVAEVTMTNRDTGEIMRQQELKDHV